MPTGSTQARGRKIRLEPEQPQEVGHRSQHEVGVLEEPQDPEVDTDRERKPSPLRPLRIRRGDSLGDEVVRHRAAYQERDETVVPRAVEDQAGEDDEANPRPVPQQHEAVGEQEDDEEEV